MAVKQIINLFQPHTIVMSFLLCWDSCGLYTLKPLFSFPTQPSLFRLSDRCTASFIVGYRTFFFLLFIYQIFCYDTVQLVNRTSWPFVLSKVCTPFFFLSYYTAISQFVVRTFLKTVTKFFWCNGFSELFMEILAPLKRCEGTNSYKAKIVSILMAEPN